MFGGEGLNRQYSAADTADFDSALDKVRTRVLVRCQFILKMISFYQDRFGTNIGKTQKEMRFLIVVGQALRRRADCCEIAWVHRGRLAAAVQG